MAKSKTWVVTTSSDQPITEVAEKLTRTGFAVSQVLDAIGIIMGTADDDVVKKLRKIPGVTDVSPEPPPINIGPPDALVS
jgi:hypothetical protein